MAVTEVQLLYQGQTSSSESKKRSYSATYRVKVDSPLDGPTQVENARGVPAYGLFYKFNNAVDPTAICKNKRSSRDPDTRLIWFVEVNWETPDPEENKDNRDDQGNPSEDPTTWRDRWEIVGSKYVGPLDKAQLVKDVIPKVRSIDAIGPPCNAAGMSIESPPPERDFSRRNLRITKFAKNYPTDVDKYDDAINSDTIRIRKPGLNLTIEPYQAKMEPVSASLQWYKRQDGVEIPYVQIVYDLALREEGWRFRYSNEGFERRQAAGDKDDNGRELSPKDIPVDRVATARIRDADGEWIVTPAMLGLDGQPQSKTLPPIYILWKGYAELPFAKLKL